MQNTPIKIEQPKRIGAEKIRIPILAPLLISILVLLATFTFAIYRLERKSITDDLYKRLDNAQKFFSYEPSKDGRLFGAMIHLLENDQKLQQLWFARDRKELETYIVPVFRKLRDDCGITHLYFIDVNQVCFLRAHKPASFGDFIDRTTLKNASQTQKPSSGVELGIYGTFTYRLVQPWYINNTLTGYIELGEEIEDIAFRLKKILDADLVFLVDKKWVTCENWMQGRKMMSRSGDWDFLPNSVITDFTMKVIPPEFLKLAGLPPAEHKNLVVSAKIDGLTYLGGCVELRDAAGQDVGDMLVIKDVSQSEAALRELLSVVATISFIIAMMLVSFFYVHVTGIEKRMVEARGELETEIEKRKSAEAELREHQDHLEETVRERTAELELTNKNLQEEVAERQKAESALRASEERFKRVAETAGDWIWEMNAEGLYTYASPVSEKLLGYKPEEIVGKKYFYDFFAPETKEEIKKAALEVFKKREGFKEFTNVVIHKNGNGIVLETTGMPVFDNNGNFRGYLGADRDVTERNKAQQRQSQLLKQLEETNKHLQKEIEQREKADKALENVNADLESTVTKLIQSNRQLREFAHLAAHDLKTPLRGVCTLAQWLAADYRDKFDEQGRRQIDLLIRRSMRLDKLLDAILQYSTLSRSRQGERPTNLNVIIDEIITEMKCPPNIKITVKNELPVLVCDESYIRQVFYNLIDNALKFMDKPEGLVVIDCTEKERFWEISVCDNGPGIEPRHFERIWTLFQTLDIRDKTENAGVGLTLVRKIVELYEGKCWVKSKVGKGSTFYFTMPKQALAAPAKKLQLAQSSV